MGHFQMMATAVMAAAQGFANLAAPSTKAVIGATSQPSDPSYRPCHLPNHPSQVHRSFTNFSSAFAAIAMDSSIVIAAAIEGSSATATSSFIAITTIAITSSSAFTSSFLFIATSAILTSFSFFVLVSQTRTLCWQLAEYRSGPCYQDRGVLGQSLGREAQVLGCLVVALAEGWRHRV